MTTDPEAAAELDAYLAALQAGRRPDRAALLAAHPSLAQALAVVEALQDLTPPLTGNADDPATLPPDAAPPADTGVLHGSDSFGPYRLLGELGRGGMGVVYKAVQVELDRPVALKMILGNHLATAQQVKRFHAEAKAAARLRHPNVVQVYESGTCAGQHYFAMEYVEGPDLDERLRAGPLPLTEAVRLLAEAARAVAHLHAHGLIHRDLKPGNILLERKSEVRNSKSEPETKPNARGSDFEFRTSDFTPKVCDFGLAKALDGASRLTASGAIVGTPSYMAPEQAAGEKGVSPRSDIYSLGAILYELLTGRPPFRADSFLDVLVQVIEKEPVPPRQIRPDLPRPLEAVCLKCLEKDPARRYVGADELADDLERWLAGEPVAAQPQGLWRRLRGWSRRQPALAARTFCLAAVVVSAEVNFRFNPHVTLAEHLIVLGLVAVWLGVSWLCQRWLASRRWGVVVPDLWSAVDVLLFTAVLLVSRNADSPLLIGYPALVAAAGLWSQVRTVWVTACMSVAGFLVLEATGQIEAKKLHDSPHHVVIVVVCLLAVAAMVAHLVQRLRVLSRTVEQGARDS